MFGNSILTKDALTNKLINRKTLNKILPRFVSDDIYEPCKKFFQNLIDLFYMLRIVWFCVRTEDEKQTTPGKKIFTALHVTYSINLVTKILKKKMNGPRTFPKIKIAVYRRFL